MFLSLGFAAGVRCVTSAFRDEPRQMLGIIQHFSKHGSSHIQGECVTVGHFWKPYIGQTVGDKLDLMVLIGGEEEWAVIQWEKSMWFMHTCILVCCLKEIVSFKKFL
jgi:hypothetical protein